MVKIMVPWFEISNNFNKPKMSIKMINLILKGQCKNNNNFRLSELSIIRTFDYSDFRLSGFSIT